MSVFDYLPYKITTATVIAVTVSTYDTYGNPIESYGSEATTAGFFQLGGAFRGVFRGGLSQSPDTQYEQYDAVWFGRPSSTQMSEDDIFLLDSYRYRCKNVNKVLSLGTAIDHYEYLLNREELVE